MPPNKKLKIKKTCTGCQVRKSINKDHFIYDGETGRYGFSRICVRCANRVKLVVEIVMKRINRRK